MQNFCKRHSRAAQSCQHHLAKVSLCHFTAANLNFCRWNDFRFASLNHRLFYSLPHCTWQSVPLFLFQIAQNENNTSSLCVCAFTPAAETGTASWATGHYCLQLVCHQRPNKLLPTGEKNMERDFKAQWRVSSYQKHAAGKGCLGLPGDGSRAGFWDSLLASHCPAKLKWLPLSLSWQLIILKWQMLRKKQQHL